MYTLFRDNAVPRWEDCRAKTPKSFEKPRGVRFFEENTKFEKSSDGSKGFGGSGFSGPSRTEDGIEPESAVLERVAGRPVEAFTQDIYKLHGVWA